MNPSVKPLTISRMAGSWIRSFLGVKGLHADIVKDRVGRRVVTRKGSLDGTWHLIVNLSKIRILEIQPSTTV